MIDLIKNKTKINTPRNVTYIKLSATGGGAQPRIGPRVDCFPGQPPGAAQEQRSREPGGKTRLVQLDPQR